MGGGQQISWGLLIYLSRDSKKKITKIEAYAGMSERMVRYLEIEEALQDEIKDTIEHNNQSYFNRCDLLDKWEITTRLNLPLHMIWASRRDLLVGDMTHLVGMPSSLVEESRGSLECSSIPRPAGSVMLQKIDEENQKNISTQRTSRKAQNVWRIMLY